MCYGDGGRVSVYRLSSSAFFELEKLLERLEISRGSVGRIHSSWLFIFLLVRLAHDISIIAVIVAVRFLAFGRCLIGIRLEFCACRAGLGCV